MSEKEYFNNAADTWDERFHTPSFLSFLDKLVPQFGIETEQNVLDVGTGTGVLIPYLIHAVGPSGSVTAIDYSERMVQICKTKHSHFKNVNIKVGNIEEDSFPVESFDYVICFGVFPHLKNRQKALQTINTILITGGKLVIAHAFSSEELKSHHKKVSIQVANDALPKKTEMMQLLDQTGFTQITINDEPGCYICISHKV
ncbi:class I SAM-dependent methyltransferase [Thermoproteota archaeon]